MYATYIHAEYYESIIAETYLLYGENIFSLGVHYTTSAFNGINSIVFPDCAARRQISTHIESIVMHDFLHFSPDKYIPNLRLKVNILLPRSYSHTAKLYDNTVL